ncbi:DUF2783 domain-containing protein [uncultured Sphaerotilus sp.]|uniref:DUF2783 domain-containing protein n=1 Tax=uncultured Sphaerotilus sp. TaxID=474984 RepID=UPI0030CA4099
MLKTQPNFGANAPAPLRAYTPGDDFYDLLIDTHRGLDDDTSRLVNARLILLLANHIGDMAVLREALAAAILPPSPPADDHADA